MDKDQRAEKLKQIESEAREKMGRIVYVPPAVSPNFLRLSKWLVLFVGVAVALMSTIFGLPMAVGAIGVLIIFLDLCFWK